MSAPIPPEQWGKDHLGTLVYLETLVVDHGGLIETVRGQYAARMRPRGTHPTILRDGTLVHDHGDFDCLEDMRAAGILTGYQRNKFAAFKAGTGPDPSERPYTPIVLTPSGWRLAHFLRKRRGLQEGLPSVVLVLMAIGGEGA